MAAPDHIGHQSGPPGLMGRSQACPIVTVKVLEEQHVVAPARVGLHPFDPAALVDNDGELFAFSLESSQRVRDWEAVRQLEGLSRRLSDGDVLTGQVTQCTTATTSSKS